MPIFTQPSGDDLLEVNHCHGPGKGHPCDSPNEAANRANPSHNTGADTVIHRRAMEMVNEIKAGGDSEAAARKELALYPADSPIHGWVQQGLKPRKSLGDRLQARAAGMHRDRLARGGAAAAKQRQRDFQMERGRQTQRLVKQIRQQEDITTPDTPENAAHFSVGIEHTPLPNRPWRVVTASGRTLKRFNSAEDADKFVKSGKAYHAAQRWAPGKAR